MYQQVFEIYGRTVNCKLESSVNVRRSLNYPTRTCRHQKYSRSWYKFSILVLIELNHICDRITYIFPNSIHLETVQFNLLSFNTEVVHLSSCTARKSCVSSLILYVYMVLQTLCPYILQRSDFYDCFDSLGGVLHGYFPLCSTGHSVFSWPYVGRNGGRNQILHYTQSREAV